MSSGSRSDRETRSPQSGARRARSRPLVDAALVGRRRAAPESGPRIVFLSGGTALRRVSRALKALTHNSIHLITPFDSGGSSAALRDAFRMPAVGDLRNRLLALADARDPALQALFAHRLPHEATGAELRARLDDLVSGRDPLFDDVPDAARAFAMEELAHVAAALPGDFDLRGASVGNLVLTGGYLADGNLDPVITRFREQLCVRGDVRLTVDADLHLEARLVDGTRIRGQHRITGKQLPALGSPIQAIRLTRRIDGDPDEPAVRPVIADAVADLIRQADLVCFPMGSFYSSVLCNLLPAGVGAAIRDARCAKLYVPSTGLDPELPGADVAAAAERLLATLREDTGADTPTHELLSGVLLDTRDDVYAVPPNVARLDALGVPQRRGSLVAPGEAHVDPEQLAEILLTAAEDPTRWKAPDE